MERRFYLAKGLVQGVGFRPFVYQLAKDLGLTGWVCNTGSGVQIEVQGPTAVLDTFAARLQQPPPHAKIDELQQKQLSMRSETGFCIEQSSKDGGTDTVLIPDLAPCTACLRELFDPSNRRYRYPFTNCTHCGPRFSIIKSLPYDREETSMHGFRMCFQCQQEYDNPQDRRFHAQPNACPTCGPELALGQYRGNEALLEATDALRSGAIVAVKGVGGYQLMVDACNEKAVHELRRRKSRPHKPFALLYPAVAAVEEDCFVSDVEKQLLSSPAAPIVLLKAKKTWLGVAPQNPYLGVMLPASPLHHLLMAELPGPVVATSGNRSGDPICCGNEEALENLGEIADLFLQHNRPIQHFVDDAVVQVVAGRPQVLRRARGYASLPIQLKEPAPPCLAVGAHQKNTVAARKGDKAYVSQHIGDLSTEKSYEAFCEQIQQLQRLYGIDPEVIVADAHPDYLSTRYASQLGKPLLHCQHHLAHVLACMAEQQLEAPLLGIAWDGTGLGSDGTVWGGECFEINADDEARIAFLRPFRLPGGERAIKEPKLTASGLLYETFGPQAIADQPLLLQMLQSGFRSPLCSSAGRLFDGVASLLGLRDMVSFEGQAAMELEFLAEKSETTESYPFVIQEDGMIDWEPLIAELLSSPTSKADKARTFHHTLAEMILAVAKRSGRQHVVLSGGVFQNRLLSKLCIDALRKQGYTPHWHERIPCNDGGIALGQLHYAGRQARLCV